MRVLFARDRIMLSQFADIGACDKSLLAGASHDDHSNGGIVLDVMKRRPQLFHGGHVERVQYLGPVDGDVRNRAFFLEKNVFKVHEFQPTPISADDSMSVVL